jgi:SAM-dependent methyltransferase
VASRFYDVASFRRTGDSLHRIEKDGIGEIRGRRVLHLMCHFGMDSISLAKRGASVVGVDFSPQAIAYATTLAHDMGADASFICADVFALGEHTDERFDMVYMTYGVLGWLDEMAGWARIVAAHLKPGGRLYLIDFHPVYWMLSGRAVAYPYDSAGKPIVITPQGTYADRSATIRGNEYWWNHGLGTIIDSLIAAGLEIAAFAEHPCSPYDGGSMREVRPGAWMVKGLEGAIPILFELRAVRSRRPAGRRTGSTANHMRR